MLVCVTKSQPLDNAGKAPELGVKYSSSGATDGFLPPFKTTSVDFNERGESYVIDNG